MYKMQILIGIGEDKSWKDVHPTSGDRYEYHTKKEADDMLNMCYPECTKEQVRVVTIPIVLCSNSEHNMQYIGKNSDYELYGCCLCSFAEKRVLATKE